MTILLNELRTDIRFVEGLNACMSCGVCTAICPAAAYFDYDPRKICLEVQSADKNTLKDILSSEEIWMCGQCLSCKTRCPRGNTPGYVIQVLRRLSQESGLFVHSRLGRQQLLIKRTIGHSILETGYCVHPRLVKPELHPEQGPVWQWVVDNGEELFPHLGSNYYKPGQGGVRQIDSKTLKELRHIFEETGAIRLFEQIEKAMETAGSEVVPTSDCL